MGIWFFESMVPHRGDRDFLDMFSEIAMAWIALEA
jgi:hypothetical protein